jgi:2-dehydro-3-deoxyphosphogluconate aldolase / (4S)-4-hydroxy-2-oxoglutarate aldolase
VNVVERIHREQIVAVLRGVMEPDRVVDVLAAAGIGVVEITLETPGALDAIRRLRSRGDVSVLAGTVRTLGDVEAAVEAGAEACVEPAFVPSVVARCRELDVPAIPGALSPSEIEAAWSSGAALVKLFPARLGGPAYVADVVKPLPDVPLICTGGVTSENAGDFLTAGAAAVGVSFRTGATEADGHRLVETVRQDRLAS